MNGDIEAMILERASHQELQRTLAHKGFRPISRDAIDAVIQGQTSISEITRVIGAL
jgi:type II secretory ATPase GspE/PulE/Tfp pilus assembly ATPase PilB-like protein